MLLLAVSPSAFALNPALDVSQYAHTPWRISDGFAKGYIYAIAQTPDGYLWLGTEFGVLRFDGVRKVGVQLNGGVASAEAPAGTADASIPIYCSGPTVSFPPWRSPKSVPTRTPLNPTRELPILAVAILSVWRTLTAR